MAYVNLLRARRVGTRELPRYGSETLKFCKRIKRGVVIKVVVRRQLLVIGEGMIYADLGLIPSVSVVRDLDVRVCASAGPGTYFSKFTARGSKHWLGITLFGNRLN